MESTGQVSMEKMPLVLQSSARLWFGPELSDECLHFLVPASETLVKAEERFESALQAKQQFQIANEYVSACILTDDSNKKDHNIKQCMLVVVPRDGSALQLLGLATIQ